MESHWTSRHVSCIVNVAIVLPTKVSQFKLVCLKEGHRSSSFSLWFSKVTCLIEWRAQWLMGRVLRDRGAAGLSLWPASLHCGPWAIHIYPSLVLVQSRKSRPWFTERLLMGHKGSNQTNVWLNGTKFSGISVEVSSSGIHVLPPGQFTSDILTSTHANYVVLKQHTCMPVAETQDLQACVFVTSHQQQCMLQLHPTNRNAGYSCIESVCMSVILVLDQQPSHYCHRVSRHLYHFHVWFSTHVWNQDSRPAVI